MQRVIVPGFALLIALSAVGYAQEPCAERLAVLEQRLLLLHQVRGEYESMIARLRYDKGQLESQLNMIVSEIKKAGRTKEDALPSTPQ